MLPAEARIAAFARSFRVVTDVVSAFDDTPPLNVGAVHRFPRLIVPTAAIELAAKYHNRMPVLIHPADFAGWLDPVSRPGNPSPLLLSHPLEGMEVAAANPLVNNPRKDRPEALAPVTWHRP